MGILSGITIGIDALLWHITLCADYEDAPVIWGIIGLTIECHFDSVSQRGIFFNICFLFSTVYICFLIYAAGTAVAS